MSKKKHSAFTPYFVILCALALMWLLSWYMKSVNAPASVSAQTANETAVSPLSCGDSTTAAPSFCNDCWSLPVLQNEQPQQIIQHLAYTVSYNPDWYLPNWVAYCLTAEEVGGDAKREQTFSPDPEVKQDAVLHSDYTHSGYDRGHMAPAADFKFSAQAMRESFYTTNICPQNQNLNRGDWNDIEELVRDLALRYNAIYIACGPVVYDTRTTIGTARKIVVPQGFYKVLLRQTNQEPGYAAIGFYCPNEAGNRPIMTYGKSVDEIEALTGIDFFSALPDSIETAVERDFDFALWTVN